MSKRAYAYSDEEIDDWAPSPAWAAAAHARLSVERARIEATLEAAGCTTLARQRDPIEREMSCSIRSHRCNEGDHDRRLDCTSRAIVRGHCPPPITSRSSSAAYAICSAATSSRATDHLTQPKSSEK